MQTHPHSFHIPVMGTGFTLDTPLRVARYGISSVISLVDDVIIERSRKYYCRKNDVPYEPIAAGHPDARAKRITAYLNLLDELVKQDIEVVKQSPFENGSEITRYFELIPPSPLKDLYEQMLATDDPKRKKSLETELRGHVVPGSIDVNIMTKLDVDRYENGSKLPAEFADGMAALRGFALSRLNSSIVLSAGINQRLYTYARQFDDFLPGDQGATQKHIILKVSDFRSAQIQGKFLAKRGLWVSEFRIESGLNCGGHAFTAECNLLGPVLEAFKSNRESLRQSLFKIYQKALSAMDRPFRFEPPEIRVTVQGGIGTAHENRFLLQYYCIDGTGWGTPFMLVPEVTSMDPAHLEKLCKAAPGDIYLSNSSPLGVPFWNLRTSASEEKRKGRIEKGKPGSPCAKGFLSLNKDFTKHPICVASRDYISRKLEKISREVSAVAESIRMRNEVLEKSCICHDLGGSITLNQNGGSKATPAICCGPNIRYFHRIFSMEEMVNHIYGRLSVFINNERPHMFVEEMRLNLEYLHEEIRRFSQKFSDRPFSFLVSFKTSLLEGVDYYQELTKQFVEEQRERFLSDLKQLKMEIEDTCLPAEC
ncbi:MAG: hypothetical protein HKP58_05490 [Desulfatitalea sp.]|nr:hypothetical protein [Desulfatitalea sp.]NNJ99847.1 hypothetical protein [Desulfatitalea sp.]